MEDKTCSTCKYKRIMPIWTSGTEFKVSYHCCRDKFVSIDPDDTCDYWDGN